MATTVNNSTKSFSTVTNEDLGGSATDLDSLTEFNLTGPLTSTSVTTSQLTVNGTATVSGDCTLSSTTQSDDKYTGALVLQGGLGVEKNVNVGGNAVVLGTISTQNVYADAASVTGTSTLGVVNCGNTSISGTLGVSNTSTLGAVNCGNTAVTGTLSASGDVTISSPGTLTLTSTTNATSTLSGALKVAGGMSCQANLYAGNVYASDLLRCNGSTESTSKDTGAFVISNGGMGVESNANIGANLRVYGTTDSTSSTTGAIISDGGIGTAKQLFVGTNLRVRGTTAASNTTTGTVNIGDGSTAATNTSIGGGAIYTGGVLRVKDSTDTASTTDGAVVIGDGVTAGTNVAIGNGNVWAGNGLRGASLYTNSAAIERGSGTTSGVLDAYANLLSYTGTVATLRTSSAANQNFNFLDCKANEVSRFRIDGEGFCHSSDRQYRVQSGIGEVTCYGLDRIIFGAHWGPQLGNFLIINGALPSPQGVILPSGNTAWSAYSDRRIKEDIVDLSYGLESILQLKPRHFKLKGDKTSKRRMGFVAQEVAKVLPETVSGDLTTMDEPELENPEKALAVCATDMIPVLVKALQELYAEVADLRGRIKPEPIAAASNKKRKRN